MPTFAELIEAAPRLRRSVLDDVTGNAVISPGNEPDPDEIVQRSLFLPVGRTRSGDIVPAAQGPIAAIGGMIAGLPDAPAEAVRAVNFFGDVAAGRKGVFDPEIQARMKGLLGAGGVMAERSTAKVHASGRGYGSLSFPTSHTDRSAPPRCRSDPSMVGTPYRCARRDRGSHDTGGCRPGSGLRGDVRPKLLRRPYRVHAAGRRGSSAPEAVAGRVHASASGARSGPP